MEEACFAVINVMQSKTEKVVSGFTTNNTEKKQIILVIFVVVRCQDEVT